MNWKVTLLLIVVFFAFTVTAVAISLSAPNLSVFSASEKTMLPTGFEPLGEPIDGSGPPN